MRAPPYELHLVPPDLRREEAMHQIADALDYVKMITNDVFQKIHDRVGEYNNRLKAVCDRADLAQLKVNRIRGSSKATKVFSSYKYPGVELFDEYKVLFTRENGLKDKCQQTSYHVKSKHIAPDEKILKEKLQFYNVRVPERQKERNQMTEEGLGSLPKELDSLSTLLLFNTSENPYKKYVMLDPLGAVTKTRKSLEEETQGDSIGAAPITISQRDQIEAVEKDNYFYNPGLGEVPEINVPLALPDLPGIADDLLYIADLGPSIAPSSLPMFAGSALPDLPSLVPESPMSVASGSLKPEVPTGGNDLPHLRTSVPSISETTSLPPPPPPPPPPPVLEPPPPSTIPEDTSKIGKDLTENRDKITAAPDVTINPDARANLLESIRQAGGKAKLRNVADRKLEAKKKKQEEKRGVGGDLMSDLFNKLQMRRKGISGVNRSGSVSEGQASLAQPLDPVVAMGRISAMIPPPPPNTGNKEASDDEDWD